ncbi:helix-turn-helix domain-containing protein [Actinokineospora xionganensis]|nr:helix-turn-helix domain-containing protein [Actinokineospora xionganensis]
MSRFRLQPTSAQERALLEHCGHARFVWNPAVEQHAHWQLGRKSAPGFVEQCRQLTEARAVHPWLAAGSVIVQQQALKDFGQAMANFFGRFHRRPSWRRRERGEGFRIVAVKLGDVRRISRKVGEVRGPKVGWVRFRWSRAVVDGVKSYRVTRDQTGRWHMAFAVVPEPIAGPGSGAVVGVDRGARESQAAFRCRSFGLARNADVNAALNIRLAAGHAVTARGGPPLGEPANREPQHDDHLLVR